MSPVVMDRWLRRIRRRLESQDAELELWHLSRLSQYELETLVRLERTGGVG